MRFRPKSGPVSNWILQQDSDLVKDALQQVSGSAFPLPSTRVMRSFEHLRRAWSQVLSTSAAHRLDRHRTISTTASAPMWVYCLQGIGARDVFARALRYHASSPFNGVCWDARVQKFASKVSFQGVTHHAGHFRCEIEAAHAYDERLRHLCQDGARLKRSLNFPSFAEVTFTESPEEARARALAKGSTNAKEEESFRRLYHRFSVVPQATTHEIVRVSDSSKVDALFQPKGSEHGGLPLQLKAASLSGNCRQSYSFQRTKGYHGMLLLFIALDRDFFWAMPGTSVALTAFTIRLGSDRDETLRVNDLGSTLDSCYGQQQEFPHVSLRNARLQCGKCHLVEERAHLQMSDVLGGVGYQLKRAFSGTAVDSLLVGDGGVLRVQEKASTLHQPRGTYRVSLCRTAGALGTLAYSEFDFDILLVAILENEQVVGIFVFASDVLAQHGLIGGKPSVLPLWPAWRLPKRQAYRVRSAWQLEHFVDLRGWSGQAALPDEVRRRLAQLLQPHFQKGTAP